MTSSWGSKRNALALVVGFPLGFVLVQAGCSRASKPGEAKPGASSAPAPSATEEKAGSESDQPSTSASAPSSAAAAPAATGCEGRMQEFDKVLASATYSCEKDADCLCFGGGLSRGRGSECGGIVDIQTGKKLAAIEKAAKPEKCSNGAMCEPWTCDPICEANRCQKGPRKGKKK